MLPADRVVVDWRISEYELVDDDEAIHLDKPVVPFLPRNASAERGNATVSHPSVCPSVCLSVRDV